MTEWGHWGIRGPNNKSLLSLHYYLTEWGHWGIRGPNNKTSLSLHHYFTEWGCWETLVPNNKSLLVYINFSQNEGAEELKDPARGGLEESRRGTQQGAGHSWESGHQVQRLPGQAGRDLTEV